MNCESPHPTDITRLTRSQVREIDRLSVERYHIPGIVLMENAARAATGVACDILIEVEGAEVLILCGGGNNGGDGLAVARHLHNRGAEVTIALATDPGRYKGDALTNWRIVEAMKLPTVSAEPETIADSSARLVIDAIFGTGLSEPPREPFPRIAESVNRLGKPVLAIDIPSGLDCDTGQPRGACIVATRTITFVAEKTGFAHPSAKHYLGKVVVGEIGCPKELVAEVRDNANR